MRRNLAEIKNPSSSLNTKEISRQKKPVFVLHGGGPIGLGLLADIVSGSDTPYEIIATSNNELVTLLINSTNSYKLLHQMGDHTESSEINNVTMVSRDENVINQVYAKAQVLAISLTQSVFDEQVDVIAKALIHRAKENQTSLCILICINMVNADNYVMTKIKERLNQLLNNEFEADSILSRITFVPTVVDRMVARISEEEIKREIRAELGVHLKDYSSKQIDDIIGSPLLLARYLKQFNLSFHLFNAEKKYVMYVPDKFTHAGQFKNMRVTRNLKEQEEIKNKLINGPHAVLAWLGGILGYATIGQAIREPGIYLFLKKMMKKEICPILLKAYPNIKQDELNHLQDLFFERCLYSLSDPIERVGRDPLRKLKSGERIKGVLELQEKYKLNIATPGLLQSIALGMLYAINKIDPHDKEAKKMRQLYKRHRYTFLPLLCSNDGPCLDFHSNKDQLQISKILQYIYALKRALETNAKVNPLKKPIASSHYSEKENDPLMLAGSSSSLFYQANKLNVSAAPGEKRKLTYV